MSLVPDEVPEDADGVWPQPASLRRPHQIAGIGLLGLGLFVIWQALALRYYTSLGPGPGFFSFWLGVLLSVLALCMIVTATWGRPEPLPQPMFAEAMGYVRLAAVVAALLMAWLLLRPLGYSLTMLLIMAMLLRVGGSNWLVTAIGSLIGSFGIYYVFVHWLRVPLPAGLLS